MAWISHCFILYHIASHILCLKQKTCDSFDFVYCEYFTILSLSLFSSLVTLQGRICSHSKAEECVTCLLISLWAVKHLIHNSLEYISEWELPNSIGVYIFRRAAVTYFSNHQMPLIRNFHPSHLAADTTRYTCSYHTHCPSLALFFFALSHTFSN